MKKFIPFLIIGVVAILVILIRGQINNTSLTASNPINNLFKKEIVVGDDVCAEFPAKFVEASTGKKIIKTTKFDSNGTHVCDYFTSENGFVTIHVENLNFANQKKGVEFLDHKTTTDPSIKMEHFVAWQDDNVYGVYLKLNPDKFISISRGSLDASTNEENMKLAVAVVDWVQKGENQGLVSAPTIEPTKRSNGNVVPLPQEKDIINNFFQLIAESKPSDAVMMMTADITKNDSSKQAYGVQFNAFASIKVKSIEPSMSEEWTTDRHTYKVILEVKMKPETASVQPIPNYGFENGENYRWVTILKEGSLWKIEGLATGP